MRCARAPARQPAPSWQQPRTPDLTPVSGTSGLHAAACGACHTEHYADWQTSAHANAWTDAQFQAELQKDPEVAWLCINCHTPLPNQQVERTTATADVRHPLRQSNPLFDAGLQAEGVTCLTCHWRPDGIAAVHADTPAPHPLVAAPELRSETTCTVCHQAVARVEDSLVCAFNTGQEWQDAGIPSTCPECHMPTTTRAPALGAAPRAVHRHTFPGSLIPKTGDAALATRNAEGWSPGVTLTTHVDSKNGVLTATVTNTQAGHYVPTGDPERYLEVFLEAKAPDGTVVAASQHRIGQVWVWWPVAERQSDNRLAPGESRSLTLALPPTYPALEIQVRLDHVRISDENADHHNLTDYPRRRTVSQIRQTIPPTSTPLAPPP